MFAEPPSGTSLRILDMLEEKGFKVENIVDYTGRKTMGFPRRNW
jgi:DNA-binding PadR family transcriptional regulator